MTSSGNEKSSSESENNCGSNLDCSGVRDSVWGHWSPTYLKFIIVSLWRHPQHWELRMYTWKLLRDWTNLPAWLPGQSTYSCSPSLLSFLLVIHLFVQSTNICSTPTTFHCWEYTNEQNWHCLYLWEAYGLLGRDSVITWSQNVLLWTVGSANKVDSVLQWMCLTCRLYSGVGAPGGPPHGGDVDGDPKGDWTYPRHQQGRGERALQSHIGRPWHHGWWISGLHVNHGVAGLTPLQWYLFYRWERAVSQGRLVGLLSPLEVGQNWDLSPLRQLGSLSNTFHTLLC